MRTTTVGEFILDRLKDIGITEVIGVPGDYNLSFLEQINAADGIRFVGACNELNAAYAADGYARQRGVGALLSTYGVGELSALNGIAGARSEHVPMVSIAGAPPLYATEYAWHLHHTLADGDYTNMLDAISQFTALAIRVTPMNVVEEVDRALRTCLREKRPVHIQIPSDITHLSIQAPEEALDTSLATSDKERLAAAIEAVLAKFKVAKDPILLIDQDADRHKFTPYLRAIVEKAQLPYTQLASGKAILDEQSPLFIGTYNGAQSAPGVQQRVEAADLLLTTNPRFIEVNSGSFTHSLREENKINFGDQHISIAGQYFEGINTLELLEELVERIPAATKKVADPKPKLSPLEIRKDAKLSHERMWRQILDFIREDDVVVAEAGTSNIGLSPLPMPTGVKYINSSIWGAIGFTLPAVMGSQLANRDRRHLLFIGDGSFQLTAQELSTILREDLNPIIFLLNNGGYTIERYILGMEHAYNDVQNWDYGALPKVFMQDTSMQSYSARTEGELAEILGELSSATHGALVELHLDPFDAPEGLKALGPLTAEFDYGPRGPRNDK